MTSIFPGTIRGLIASDIDGTLLPENGTVLPPALFDQIRRLTGEGWRFCPASGRQYTSLRRLFAPVAEEVFFLCENGAVVFSPEGKVLAKTVMPRPQAEAICRDILALPGCEALISGENMSYVIPKTEDMVELMGNVKGNNVTAVSAPEEVPEEIIKVSVYCPAGTGAIPSALAEKWRLFHPAVAGGAWMDFTLSDKGTGLALLCKALGVEYRDVVAFGDNYNDVPMLSLAGRPYLMDSADGPLLERFPVHCHNVVEILKTM